MRKPDEVRPLDNLDAKGLSAREAIVKAMSAVLGQERLPSRNSSQAVTIKDAEASARCVLVRTLSSTRGMTATVRRQRRKELQIRPEDSTDLALRNVVLLPKEGEVGLVLAERFGRTGTVTAVKTALKALLKKNVPNLNVHIEPAMSEAAMAEWARSAQIKGIELVVRGETRADEISRSPVMRFPAKRRRWWNWEAFGGFGKVTPERVVREIVPLVPGVESPEGLDKAADTLLAGWQVAFDLSKDNKHRQYYVGGDMPGLNLAYPFARVGELPDNEFQAECRKAIGEFREDHVISLVDESDCAWDPLLEIAEPWEGDWGVELEDAETLGNTG